MYENPGDIQVPLKTVFELYEMDHDYTHEYSP